MHPCLAPYLKSMHQVYLNTVYSAHISSVEEICEKSNMIFQYFANVEQLIGLFLLLEWNFLEAKMQLYLIPYSFP